MLSTHYRNPLNFSDEAIEQAEGAVAQNRELRHKLQAPACRRCPLEIPIDDEQEIQSWRGKWLRLWSVSIEKMSDDFNTPDALSAVFELVSVANQLPASRRLWIEGSWNCCCKPMMN